MFSKIIEIQNSAKEEIFARLKRSVSVSKCSILKCFNRCTYCTRDNYCITYQNFNLVVTRSSDEICTKHVETILMSRRSYVFTFSYRKNRWCLAAPTPTKSKQCRYTVTIYQFSQLSFRFISCIINTLYATASIECALACRTSSTIACVALYVPLCNKQLHRKQNVLMYKVNKCTWVLQFVANAMY